MKPFFRTRRATTLGTLLSLGTLALLPSCSDDDEPGVEAPAGGRWTGGSAGRPATSAGRGGNAGQSEAGASGTADEPGGSAGSGGPEAGGEGGDTSGVTAGGGGEANPPSIGDAGAGGAAGSGAGAGGAPAAGGSGEAGAGGDSGIVARCGDGLRAASEACDDGGVAPNDGCSSTCAIEYVLDSGHIDLFEVTYDHGPVLKVKDDSRLYSMAYEFREPERVVIDVDATLALRELPESLPPELSFLGPPGALRYILPFNQAEGLPWAGWSTQRLEGSLPAELAAEFDYASSAGELEIEITGPGDVFTYLIGDGVEGRYIDTSDDTPERIPLGLSTHYHTAWVFTALGDYVFKVTPRLFPKTLGTLTGVPREFRFHVGTRLVPEEPAPAPALTLESQGPYRAGEAVELRVQVAPQPVSPRYEWWRWDDGGPGGEAVYVRYEGESGPTLRFAAGAPMTEQLYYALLLSNRTGRILADATALISVE